MFPREMFSSVFVYVMLLHTSSAMQYYYMDSMCGRTIIAGTDQIRIQLTGGYTYAPNMKCQLNLDTYGENQMMLYFKSMDIEQSGTCEYDFLEMDNGNSRDDPYIDGGKQCGQIKPAGVFTTSGRYLTLYFQSDSTEQFGGFDMIVTPYHTGHCFSNEYKCDNQRCIDDSLTCNDYNPCGDFSDCNIGLTSAAIAGIILGCIAFTVIVIVIIVGCRRRTVYMQQPIHVAPVASVTSAYGYNQIVSPPPYSGYNGNQPYQQNSYQKY